MGYVALDKKNGHLMLDGNEIHCVSTFANDDPKNMRNSSQIKTCQFRDLYIKSYIHQLIILLTEV